MPYFPALNEVNRQVLDEEPEFADPNERAYIVLFPEDHDGCAEDMEGNVALLVDEDQAREVRRLANNAIDTIGDGAEKDGIAHLRDASESLEKAIEAFEDSGDGSAFTGEEHCFSAFDELGEAVNVRKEVYDG
jgi:hypothetical protein